MPLVKPPPPAPRTVDERRHPRDRAGLLAQLASPDPGERRWAARDLGGDAAAAPALVAQLLVEPDRAAQDALLEALTRIGGEVAVGGLVRCLRTEASGLRNQAIEALAALPAEVSGIMDGLLTDPDPDVRIFAVNVLESLRHPRVEGWLLSVIERDPHVNVCAAALDLLGEVGSERAGPALRGLKARFPDEPYIGFAADLALGRLG